MISVTCCVFYFSFVFMNLKWFGDLFLDELSMLRSLVEQSRCNLCVFFHLLLRLRIILWKWGFRLRFNVLSVSCLRCKGVIILNLFVLLVNLTLFFWIFVQYAYCGCSLLWWANGFSSNLSVLLICLYCSGIYIINLGKTWEKLLLAARVIVAIENPQDMIVQSARPYGQRAVLKFAQYTGAHAIAGRHTPGTFTNQMQTSFSEPRLLILTDPRTDHQVNPNLSIALSLSCLLVFCALFSVFKF